VTQMVWAERAAALRNKCLNLAKTCRSGSGPASARMSTFMLVLWMAAVPALFQQSGIAHNAICRINWRSA
jgi:hypothetical protein